MSIIRIYTDGGCSGNQERINFGGWGAVLEMGEHQKELFGGETNTTNNTQTTNVAAVAAPAAGGVTAVPTLDLWALLALSGLLPLVARRRRG